MPDGSTQLADLVPGAPRARRPEPPAPRKPQPVVPAVTLAPRPQAAADSEETEIPAPAPAVHSPAPVVEMRALGQRIREPFYSQLTALVYELDRRRIRTNKTEVLEFLLAGLPADERGLDAFAAQIGQFRAVHPRAS